MLECQANEAIKTSQMLRNRKLCRSCWKSRAWAAHGIVQSQDCENWENVRKAGKMCVFCNRTPKKKLWKPCEKLMKSLNFRNISQNSSIFTLSSVGRNSPLRKVVQIQSTIREMLCISPYFRKEVLLWNAQYFADIIRTCPWCSQLFAIPVLANPGDAHRDVPRL